MQPIILFLGYGPAETRLHDYLADTGCVVHHERGTLDLTVGYDMAVSFGYRHIIKGAALAGPAIVNLHIGYLPWNRGAHPNYWSWATGTPSGVTIHRIDAGIDTGPIYAQRLADFNRGERTYRDTHARLLCDIEELFMQHWPDILSGRLEPVPQDEGMGSFHRVCDLPADFPGWDSPIPFLGSGY